MQPSAIMLTQEALANPCSQNTGGNGIGAADEDNAIGQEMPTECNFNEVITFDPPTHRSYWSKSCNIRPFKRCLLVSDSSQYRNLDFSSMKWG